MTAVAPLTVAEAQAALDAAKAAVADMEHSLCEAKREMELAQDALHDARVNADAALPRATMVTTSWRGSNPRSQEVVIVKRTAKSIAVRYPGADSGYTFRMGYGDVWREYPAPKGWASQTRTLEVPS